MAADARAWLAVHAPEAPAALRERMHERLRGNGDDAPRDLLHAGIDALEAALPRCDARDGALDLLAADALLTAALEAAAALARHMLLHELAPLLGSNAEESK